MAYPTWSIGSYRRPFTKYWHRFTSRRSIRVVTASVRNEAVTAIAEARTHLEEGHEWVVDIDLEKFFDQVNHECLLARLERLVSDRRLIRLI